MSGGDSSSVLPTTLWFAGGAALIAGGVFHTIWVTEAQATEDAKFVDQATFETARDTARESRTLAAIGYASAALLLGAAWWLTPDAPDNPFAGTFKNDGLVLGWRF